MYEQERGGGGERGSVPIKAKLSTISSKCWDAASVGYATNWINNFTCACTMHSSDIHSHNFHDVNVQGVPKVFTCVPVEIEILTALTINCALCWVVTSCSPVQIYRSFRGTYWLHLQGISESRKWKNSIHICSLRTPSPVLPLLTPITTFLTLGCTENGSSMFPRNIDEVYEITRLQVPENIISGYM
jgi:hypothetical protein